VDVSRRSLAGVVVSVIVLSVGFATAAGAISGQANNGTRNSPVAQVSVNPTTFPGDGQVITVEASTTSPVDLFEIRVHLCAHNAAITNQFDFGISGPHCSPNPVSPNADTEAKALIAPNSGGRGTVTFRNGIGTGKPWTDDLGNTHQLTCGPSSLCDIVVQLQVTDGTIFFTAPLDGSVATTTTSTTPIGRRPGDPLPNGDPAPSTTASTAVSTGDSSNDAGSDGTASAAGSATDSVGTQDDSNGSGAVPWLLGVGVVLAVGIGGWLVVRSRRAAPTDQTDQTD
jgi:hypothetical protein